MELLEVLAVRMGCSSLSDLRFLPRPNPALRHAAADIPLCSHPQQEWLDAADYLCSQTCSTILEAKEALLQF